MEVKKLSAKYHTDEQTGCLVRYVRSTTEIFGAHCHDYYEIFFVLKGEAHHIINEKEQILREGSILFIRDFDVHNYKRADGEYFEFLNIAFTKETFDALMTYLESGFPKEKLMEAETAPYIQLGQSEKEKLFYAITEINQSRDKKWVKMRMRALILDIFVKYFCGYSQKKTEVPLWLEMTCEKMKKPANFIAGAERMIELSGKSREHVSRSIKKYYGKTLSEYISALRLEYCANLLSASNLSVTDICYECGFDNISWFYKLFSDKFGMTPKQYRKKYER